MEELELSKEKSQEISLYGQFIDRIEKNSEKAAEIIRDADKIVVSNNNENTDNMDYLSKFIRT